MSMDKFFLGNTTIIEPTYGFYNNDITKNAIIFIDEFDATRDRLLNQIITRGLENHIDYLGLFHRVYASLKIRDFPAELTTASKLQQTYLDEHKNAKNPMEIIERFGGVFDETYDRFAMQYSFKTEEDGKGDRSRNFIFNDLQFHSVFEGENAFIDIDTDMKAKQNWLRFTKRRPTEKDGGVLSLLASVKGCLTYFQNGARNLSFNYKHHKDEDKRPGDDDYTFENAIESVLTEFHLSREQIRYLKPIVMGGQVKSKKDKKDSNGKMSLKYFDRSVYDRGFRYYDFIDDPNHSMRSEIQLFDFQDSPERILLHLSEKAQIIGISATATNDIFAENAWYFRNALVRANYNDLKNGVHETTEYLELFLRNLLLDEKNELHNRTMHISGRFAEVDIERVKVDIESGEVDIESTKVDIRNKLLSFSDTISEKTINHTVEIFSKCGKENCFGRTIVEEITGLKPSGASKLIKLLVDSEVIVPVTGHGKGKYRFQ